MNERRDRERKNNFSRSKRALPTRSPRPSRLPRLQVNQSTTRRVAEIDLKVYTTGQGLVADKVISRYSPVDYLPIYFGEELPFQCGSDSQEQYPRDTERYGNMACYRSGSGILLELNLSFP